MALCNPNRLASYFVLLVWMAVNITLFVITYMDFAFSRKYHYLRKVIKGGVPWARGASMTINFNCAIILLTMSRNLMSFLRSCKCQGSFMRNILRVFDQHVTFHRYVAYMIILCTIIHVGGHYFNFTNLVESWHNKDGIDQILSHLEDDTNKNTTWINPIRSQAVRIRAEANPVVEAFKTLPGITGVIITLCLILMVSSSTELIRRSYFEVFWYTHHLFIIFFFGLAVHGTGGVLRLQTNLDDHKPEECEDVSKWKNSTSCAIPPKFEVLVSYTWMVIIGPMFIYTLERCIRFYRATQEVEIINVIQHPSKVVEIQMKKEGFRCEAGQFIFLACPNISHLEWHPFTLTSAPEENYFSVHIRVVGNWTGKLSKKLGDGSKTEDGARNLLRLAVDGPFGTSSTDVFKYKVVMCIGAGIGVTPFASILKSLWYQLNHAPMELKVKKVYFYWICPEMLAFEWFTSLLKHFEDQMDKMNNHEFLDINLYLTRGIDRNKAKQIIQNQGTEYDILTGLKSGTCYGRPKWTRIFKNIASAHPRTNIGVFFCGPPVLSDVLEKCSDRQSDQSTGTMFIYNKENF